MATSVKTVADRVFNLLKGHGFQIDTYNKTGEVVGDPADAIRFFVEDPNLLVTLNVPKEEIRLSISDNTDQTDTLRKQLSEIAKDYLMMLDFRVFGKTLKPSSEAINISRENDMKEQNELRKLAGLPLKEERTVVGCNDDQSLYIFLNDEQVNLGKTEEEIATKLADLGDRIDFDDMYYSSSMDFASECGFPNDDSAKELMDKAIDTYAEIKFKKVRHTDGPGRDATSDDIAKINRGEEVNEEEGPGGVEDCIRMTLRKEGGAAGLGAIEKACKKAGSEDNVKDVMSKMSDVEQHSEGDYLLKESIVESTLGRMAGSIKTSSQPLGSTKIVVKHTREVNEEIRGSRSRNIQKIFIEHNEERSLFPSKNLAGARAMARHINNGGKMHDTVGESIVTMTQELKTLREFANYVKRAGLINEENNDYIELAKQHIKTIKETFKKLSGVKTYSKAVESLKDYNNVEVVNEVNLEDHFTETHFDDKVGNAHETLSKLVSKQSAFESMIMQTIESETFAGVKELISEEPLDFTTPEAKLGHQVQQLSSTAQNPQLANFLGSIGNKLSQGGSMDQFEYRAVKASLLPAQRPEQAQMAEQFTEEAEYTKFIESFVEEE